MGHRCRSHGLVPGLTTLAVRLLLSKISIFYLFALGEGDAGGLLGGEALEESHEPGIHHVQTVPQATAQDAWRDHPSQQEERQEARQGEEMIALVNRRIKISDTICTNGTDEYNDWRSPLGCCLTWVIISSQCSSLSLSLFILKIFDLISPGKSLKLIMLRHNTISF